MSAKRILSIIAFILGEAIIITGISIYRGDMSDEVYKLNLIVSTIIYCVLFIDIIVPWIPLNDKSQRKVGSIGLRWAVSWTYAIAAILVMLICNYVAATVFKTQLIIHLALILFLILGFIGVFNSSDKVSEIYEKEEHSRQGILKMKQAMAALKNKAEECTQLPAEYKLRINNLEEELRYISPSNNPVANNLEMQYVDIINKMVISISCSTLNKDEIDTNLNTAERIYQSLKSIYSN